MAKYITAIIIIFLALKGSAQVHGIAVNKKNNASISNSNWADSIVMLPVKGGKFQMGAKGFSYAEPIHTVTLSTFFISKYEITQAQWEAVMHYNESKFTNCPQCPVENVSWLDVQNFLKELNKLTGKKYRLPTEAEWEFAARGGNQSSNHRYAGSDFLGAVAWYRENSEMKTHPVGQKQPNELGLYDMLGNVSEWCNDWFDTSYYRKSGFTNPKGPVSGKNKTMRGGNIYSSGNTLNCCERINCGCDEYYKVEGIGFRIVREVE